MHVDDPKWQSGALGSCQLGECGVRWQMGTDRIFLKDGMLGEWGLSVVMDPAPYWLCSD
jgi:hypothetical protein